MRVFKFAVKNFSKYLPQAILLLFFGLVAQFAALNLPKLIGMMVDYGLNYNGEIAQSTFNPFAFLLNGNFGMLGTFQILLWMMGAFVFVLLVKHILVWVKNVRFQKIGMEFNKKLRFVSMKKFFSGNVFISPGVAYTNLNNDTTNIKEMLVACFPVMADNAFLILFGLIMLAKVNIFLFLPLVLLLPLIGWLSFYYIRATRQVTTRTRSCIVDMNFAVQENLENMPLVKQFGQEDFEKAIFSGYSRRFRDAQIRQNRRVGNFTAMYNSMKAITYVAMISVGAYLAVKGTITLGNFVELTTYTYLIVDGIVAFVNTTYLFLQYLASGNRFLNFLEIEEKIVQPTVPQFLSKTPSINFKNVSVSNEGVDILSEVSFEIPFGGKIGLTGGLGAGKSVVLKTLNRFLDATAGEVLVDEKNIKEVDLKNLRNTFGHLMEERTIFSGTIAENILFSKPKASKSELERIVKLVCAEEEIESMGGLDSAVLEKGINLSEQLKQMICVARVLLYDAPVLLLDFPLADVDVEIQQQYLDNLFSACENKTVIFSSRSDEILKRCDEVLFFESGKLLEKGTHKELMALKGAYFTAHKAQKGMEVTL